MRRGIVAAVLPLAFFGLLAAARADAVEDHGKDLQFGDPYKVRLSAALWLSKRPARDGRAVVLLADALLGDKESTVRRVSALALGKLVGDDTPTGARARAMSALDKAAARDRDRRVRVNAKKALGEIRDRMPAPVVIEDSADAHVGGVFIYISPAIDQSKKLPSGVARSLESTVRAAVSNGAPHYGLSQGGGTLPTKAGLRAAQQRGFVVGAAVASIATTKVGNAIEVSCKVALRVSPWTGSDGDDKLAVEHSASATGSGKVVAPARASATAISDCVTAVGEEVTIRQVIPFLRSFEGRAQR